MKTKSNQKNAGAWQDVQINVRSKLSALWVTLLLLYIYADILGFYSPGKIEKVMSGEIGGIQITQGSFLDGDTEHYDLPLSSRLITASSLFVPAFDRKIGFSYRQGIFSRQRICWLSDGRVYLSSAMPNQFSRRHFLAYFKHFASF